MFSKRWHLFFGVRTLVCLIRPCFTSVGIKFGLTSFVRLVRSCSTYVGILFDLRLYAQSGHVLCILLFYSVLVCQYTQFSHVLCMLVNYLAIVRPCSLYVSTVSTAVFYVFWHSISLSTLVPLVRLCSIPPCSSWYAQYGHVPFSSACMHGFFGLCLSCFTSINQCFHKFCSKHRTQNIAKTTDK